MKCDMCGKDNPGFGWSKYNDKKGISFLQVCYDCLDQAHFWVHVVLTPRSEVNYEDIDKYAFEYTLKEDK